MFCFSFLFYSDFFSSWFGSFFSLSLSLKAIWWFLLIGHRDPRVHAHISDSRTQTQWWTHLQSGLWDWGRLSRMQRGRWRGRKVMELERKCWGTIFRDSWMCILEFVQCSYGVCLSSTDFNEYCLAASNPVADMTYPGECSLSLWCETWCCHDWNLKRKGTCCKGTSVRLVEGRAKNVPLSLINWNLHRYWACFKDWGALTEC